MFRSYSRRGCSASGTSYTAFDVSMTYVKTTDLLIVIFYVNTEKNYDFSKRALKTTNSKKLLTKSIVFALQNSRRVATKSFSKLIPKSY